MRKFVTIIVSAVLSLSPLLGFAKQAEERKAKETIISSSEKNLSSLVLKHAKAMFNQYDSNLKTTWHTSHESHWSHGSHESHYSHYSHYSGY
jgi:hypothetical protein